MNKSIIIAPYAAKLQNGKRNPKNYPYFDEVVSGIKSIYPEIKVVQIGVHGERVIQGIDETKWMLPLNSDLKKLVLEADVVLTVESFLFHFCSYYNKKCIVIWGQSDPDIFGYEDQVNLLKGREYLRSLQFNDFYGDGHIVYRKDVFVEPEIVIDAIKKELQKG